MAGSQPRPLSRRSARAGVAGLALAAAASLLGSVVLPSTSWAAGSGGLAGTLATANEASKSATDILADAKRATEKARTAHVAGSIKQNGTTIRLDIVDGHGEGGGTVSEGGASFDVVVHQSKVYLKAGKATWTKLANAQAATLLAGKWLQTTTANQDFADIAKVVELVQLTNQFTPGGALIKKRNTTFGGQAAIPLFDTSKDGGTMYVAARGTPYILGLTGTKSEPGSLHFSQYNTAKVPPAPKNSINLNALENGGGSAGGGTGTGSTGRSGASSTTGGSGGGA